MEYEQACEIAMQHLRDDPFPDSDYRWKLAEGKAVADGWYFDYTYECLLDSPPDERFGGAPGFIVTDSGVRVVGWEELSELKLISD